MKTRFSTLDLAVQVNELQRLLGMRVNRVYDIDRKTYLIRLQRPDEKVVLAVESGSRIHTTTFEWPKNDAPSGFSMKLRKHLNNKRLESCLQIGYDRIVDMQFGSGDAAFHLIVELYDRGNIILADHEYLIVSLLRPRVQGEEQKFLVRETYPIPSPEDHDLRRMTEDKLRDIVAQCKASESLKKMLLPHFELGPAFMEHVLLQHGLKGSLKLKDLEADQVVEKLLEVFTAAEHFMVDLKSPKGPGKGYIILKSESLNDQKEVVTFDEFHPMLFQQHQHLAVREFDSFNLAVDEFFSQMESQKIDLKMAQQEKQAFKKLENIKKDHSTRLNQLQQDQESDRHKGELIEVNCELVERALNMIRSALSAQLDWSDIKDVVAEASESGDPVLRRVTNLRLDINHFTMLLWDPFEEAEREPVPVAIELDLDLTAQGNARKYYNKKKSAAQKEKKTLDSQSVALKSAEKKTKQLLREVAVTATVTKARKTYWFEKFYWFISSENFLVIAGRDQQQNELVVKRYMRPDDVYVHADLHGAASVIIKNVTGKPVPPKTLNEAGHMAICYSAAWDSKVVTSAWWVHSNQVSKTAPSGEYLPTGSFMIRGKKNFLPPSHLVLGFGILFRVSDEFVAAHANDRKVRLFEDDHPDIEEELELEDEEDLAAASPAESHHQEVAVDVEEKTQVAFPDTELKLSFTRSGEAAFKAAPISELHPAGVERQPEDAEEEIRFISDTRKPTDRRKQKQKRQGGHQELEESSAGHAVDATAASGKDDAGAQKRGKKGKLKKLKAKYKDQDEEERLMRMQILQGAGPKVEAGQTAAKSSSKGGKHERTLSAGQKPPPPQPKPKARAEQDGVKPPQPDAEEEVAPANDEVDMLDALVATPLPDDELLFALPMVGPYHAMITWKFKVKATPGSSKRGKAVKTAMNMFANDKTLTQRERDLLRTLKEQDLARNLPGKVKLSAPQLHKAKR